MTAKGICAIFFNIIFILCTIISIALAMKAPDNLYGFCIIDGVFFGTMCCGMTIGMFSDTDCWKHCD